VILRHLVGLLVACAVAIALAPTGSAVAKGGQSGGPIAFFFLKGSEGYEVFVAAAGNQVALETKRKRVAAAYMVRGKVTANRVDARFGNLGRIAVEFHSITGRGGSDRCRRSPLEFGFFRGTIRFRGEDGYTEVDAPSTIGLLLNPKPRRCGRRSKAATSALPVRELDTHLTAISKRKGAVTALELSRKRGASWLGLEATRQERRGKMKIFRQSSTVVGGENAFIASGPGVRPPFAFVAAPKPFTGSAVFDASAPAGSQWTGTLSAWLPGAGKVGLTGPDYALSFCRSAGEQPGCNPEPPVSKPFSVLQGSGSQSQALGEARLSWSRYLRNSASSAGSTP
jgi:hypothetical protein